MKKEIIEDVYDDEVKTDEEYVSVFSIKLITGESVISELQYQDDDNSAIMINPMIVFSTSSKEGETISMREYDPYTLNSEVIIPLSSILSVPNEVSDEFREYYVNAIIHTFIKHTRDEIYEILSSKTNDPTDEEELIMNAQHDISEFIGVVNERYSTNITPFKMDINVHESNKKTYH